MLMPCVRCSAPASSMMAFDYAGREVWLEELEDVSQRGYALCTAHADRLTPPAGWRLTDRRNVTRLFAATAQAQVA